MSRAAWELTLEDFYLTDDRWALISSILPGKEGDPGCRGRDNRLFVEAVLWIARTNTPWRGLPEHFGKWYTVYTRFRRWTRSNVWPDVFARLGQDQSCEYFYENCAIAYAPLRAILAREGAAASIGGGEQRVA